jgi:membrane protein insertase Oxa1/YidC/SpoIIIJ
MIMYRIFSLYTASLPSGLSVASQHSIFISFVQTR